MHGLGSGMAHRVLSLLLLGSTAMLCDGGRFAHTAIAEPQLDKHACINRQRWFCEEVAGLSEVPITKWKQLPNGVNILLHGGGNDIVSFNLDVHNVWEGFEVDQILQLLAKPVDADHPAYTPPLFVDIGANVGYFTASAAKAGYMVYAFEGMRQNALMVRHTLCANPDVMSKVVLYHIGLGDERKTCKVWVLGHNVGDGTLDCSGNGEGPANTKTGRAGEMHIYKLDSVLSEDIRVLKLDVEGFEPHVIRGAHQLLSSKKVNYIISEFNKEYLVLQNKGTAGITEWLDTMVLLGYKISLQSPAGPFLNTTDIKALPTKDGIFSLFFTHNRTSTLDNHGAGTPRWPYLQTMGRHR